MIRRLRIKFTVTAMLAVVSVLLLIMGIINGMNYHRVVKEADGILDILADNDGTFPKPPIHKNNDEKRGDKPGISPETPYESRYFTVQVDTEGNVLSTNTGRIAAVDEEVAEEYGEKAFARQGQRGFFGQYRYIKTEQNDGWLLIFLDCEGSLSHAKGFLAISISISFVGIVIVLLLLLFFSGKVMKPFAESYEKQKRFITDAGHEIRTPLTIIDADVEILEMETGESEWVQDIHKQVERLRTLTEDLIYLSKMEENENKLTKIVFPLSETAMDTVLSFQALAKLQNKWFHWDIEPLVSYEGDMQALHRMLSVLLDNAVKYSDEKGEIYFSLWKKNRTVHVKVFNTTKETIDPEQMRHFFERFYRMDTSRNSQTGGHGIGLSIARAVVCAHKGKITASSADGKSLCIHVTLPGVREK